MNSERIVRCTSNLSLEGAAKFEKASWYRCMSLKMKENSNCWSCLDSPGVISDVFFPMILSCSCHARTFAIFLKGTVVKDLHHGTDYIVRKDKHLNSQSPCLWRQESACTSACVEINDWLSFSPLFVVVTTWTRMEIKFEIHILMAIFLPLILSYNPIMTLSLYLCRPISLIDADAGGSCD